MRMSAIYTNKYVYMDICVYVHVRIYAVPPALERQERGSRRPQVPNLPYIRIYQPFFPHIDVHISHIYVHICIYGYLRTRICAYIRRVTRIRASGEGFPAPEGPTPSATQPQSYMKRKLNQNLSGNEVDHTNSSILLVKNMLCRTLHCQKVLN